MKETDMYGPLRDYLVEQGYEVHAEVRGCDIVAEKGEDVLAIEMKRNLSVSLLCQAAKRQKAIESVYVAVPHLGEKSNSGPWRDVCHLLRRLELGLILVKMGGKRGIEVLLDPLPFQRRRNRKEKVAVLREIHGRSGNFNEGGSYRRKVVTAYRQNAILLARFLNELGPQSPSMLRSLEAGPKTLSILSANHYGWFRRVSRGIYAVTAKGADEASSYAALWENAGHLLEKALEGMTAECRHLLEAPTNGETVVVDATVMGAPAAENKAVRD